MTDIDTKETPLRATSRETALQGVATARDRVAAAKRTRSQDVIVGAERELQAAIDQARDVDVQWGQIGVMLGIARGNAYQRYRRRPDGGHAHQARWPRTA